MAPGDAEMAELADRVRSALEAGDLDAHADLLTPDARWGPPDDPESGCRDRAEVLAWYRAAREEGVRIGMEEVATGASAIVAGVTVTAAPGGEGVARWLVLTVRDGLVCDIRGFDTREAAAARAGLPA